ncbi:uncharacterized protein LOC134225216 isoform X2 [Armigeres subalbatus]|uniref:uncharacterized protein LOC134225216 isoform X2 n=1 Tax=Armigeres subalbatus TaxID=124917 RepID=UPI002ECFF637
MEGHRNCRMLGYDKCKEYHLIRSRPSGSQRANQQNCPKLPARIWPTSEVSQDVFYRRTNTSPVMGYGACPLPSFSD